MGLARHDGQDGGEFGCGLREVLGEGGVVGIVGVGGGGEGVGEDFLDAGGGVDGEGFGGIDVRLEREFEGLGAEFGVG